MDYRFTGIVGGLLALALFLAINVVANATLRSYRVDLTEERLFSLSDGAKRIAADLDEPIRLYLFFSKDAARDVPEAADYAERVQDVLEEYVRYSNGNLILEVVDPQPFSEEEDWATREGVTGLPVGPESLYFGLVGTNATDDREVIPFFGSLAGGGIDFTSKERFLEYDIARLVYSLAHPVKKRVGVLSTLPVRGAPPNPMMPQNNQPPWKFLDQLGQFLEIVDVEASAEELPDDLDALIVLHPRELSEALLYAIDQYVMRGGSLVALVDPHCEVDMSSVDPTNPMSQMGADKSSNMNQLFQAWGFEIAAGKVAADRRNAVQVRDPGSQRGDGVAYVVWMSLAEEGLNSEDPVTSLLSSVFMVSPGSIRATEGATTTLEPLLTTSEDSMEVEASRMQFRPDPGGLLQSFVPGQKPLTLAARISGKAESAFPDGRPGGPLETEGDSGAADEHDHDHGDEGADHAHDDEAGEDEEAEKGDAADSGGHLAVSEDSIHVITIADADFLHDQWWIRESRLGPLLLGWQKTADNCDLVLNAIENLTGGKDLISIRARGRFARPFKRVEEIRRNAQQVYMAQADQFERDMQAAEQDIANLQKERDPTDPTAQFIFSPEQQRRYEEAMERRAEARKNLRDVRHNMDKDIESLGMKLKALNIFAVPALVSIVAVCLGAWRVQRRGK